MTWEGFFGYIAAISLVAVVVTAYDKWAAKNRPRHRVPEKALWGIAAAGGSVAMWLTMQVIRHKTKHKRFTVGMPLLIMAQVAAVALCVCYIL